MPERLRGQTRISFLTICYAMRAQVQILLCSFLFFFSGCFHRSPWYFCCSCGHYRDYKPLQAAGLLWYINLRIVSVNHKELSHPVLSQTRTSTGPAYTATNTESWETLMLSRVHAKNSGSLAELLLTGSSPFGLRAWPESCCASWQGSGEDLEVPMAQIAPAATDRGQALALGALQMQRRKTGATQAARSTIPMPESYWSFLSEPCQEEVASNTKQHGFILKVQGANALYLCTLFSSVDSKRSTEAEVARQHRQGTLHTGLDKSRLPRDLSAAMSHFAAVALAGSSLHLALQKVCL